MRSGSIVRRFVGLVGLLALGAAFVLFTDEEVPTVALVEPIYAAPAERVEVLSLAQDQTLGDLLSGILDANTQSGLILALREQANPRRMRPGTEVAFRWLQGDSPVLRAVDIKINADQTVRLAPTAVGWDSELIRTPFLTDTVWVAGEIRSSLWESVYGNRGPRRRGSQRSGGAHPGAGEGSSSGRSTFCVRFDRVTSTASPSSARSGPTAPCAPGTSCPLSW